MTNEVQFEIDAVNQPKYQQSGSTLVRYLLKHSGGLIKSENQANYFLIAFVVLAAIATFLILSSGGGMPYQPSPQQILNTTQPLVVAPSK